MNHIVETVKETFIVYIPFGIRKTKQIFIGFKNCLYKQNKPYCMAKIRFLFININFKIFVA